MRFLIACFLLLVMQAAEATPVNTTPVRTFAGNIDFVVTGGTRRSQPDGVNSCSVINPATTTTANLAGIPVGATVRSAYLYWAGSGFASDFNVTFNGAGVTADTQYTETISATRRYFSGVADVTTRVNGNGNVSFSGLTVDTGAAYCNVAGVLAGWSLVVIYEDTITQPFRLINFFEGFQNFWGSSITLAPNNFVIPNSAIDGKLAVLSWEGDSGNSQSRNGVTENLIFDGQNTGAIALTDALNPPNNQFNSTINQSGITTSYGVDFDVYDISNRLRAGDTAASTTYQSGQDRVFLGLELISVTNTPASDLALAKTHSGNFAPGNQGEFDLVVSNQGPLDHNGTITITDVLPTGMTFVSSSSTDPAWACVGTTTITCTRTGLLPINSSLSAVSILVDVPSGASGTVTNNASVSSDGFDPFTFNNTSADPVVIAIPDLNTSSKAVIDMNGGDALPGDTLRFDITLTDSSNTRVRVDVLDTLSALLTNLSILDSGNAISDLSSGNTLDLRGVLLLPGQSTTVSFTADIVGSAALGDVISNTADITNPVDSISVSVSSADVTVGPGGGTASGIKPLYLDNIQGSSQNNVVLPMSMTRSPLTSTSTPVNRVRIRRQDNNRQWLLTPAVTAPLGIDTNDIPVTLLMRRNNNTSTRNMRISLDYVGAASGFIGCVDLSISATGATGLSNSQTRRFNFTVGRTDTSCNPTSGLPLLLPISSQVRLTVDNEPASGPTGQAVFVYPFDGVLGTSRAELPATTVINVDSVQFFGQAYPAGAAISSATPGETVYVRTVVSDPFGIGDISAVTLDLIDPANTTQATIALDPANIVDSTASSKTYEFVYTIPGSGPVGGWTADVLAEEGTENTVTHNRTAVINVANGPTILIDKTLLTSSDPTGSSNPKSIPGATLQYTITVTNLGPGSADADSVFVIDDLPSQGRLLFNTAAAFDPIIFANGAPPSGVLYVFGGLADTNDDIEFSNDGGTTFVIPTVDVTTGIDLTNPRINYIRINPKGTLAATTSAPSFSMQLLMRLD